MKTKPDTGVCVCYGNAGNVVHHIAQAFIQRRVDMDYFSNTETTTFEYNKSDYLRLFNKKWNDYNLNHSLDIKGNILSFDEYKESMYRVLDFINNRPTIKIAEKDFLFPLIETDNVTINIKGYIDAIDNINHIVFDWKTNNKQEDFTIAAKMYCYAYYKIYNIVPRAIYYYTKLDKIQGYNFTLEEILEFEEYLKNLADEIVNKGFDISKYELGDWTNMFNTYLKQCRDEAMKRETEKNKIKIQYNIICNYIQMIDKLPGELLKIIDKKFSYDINGKEFSPLYQSKKWDGKVRLFNVNKQTLPIGLFSILKEFITDYNNHFNMNYVFELSKDYRMPLINVDNKYIKNNDYELRYYQEDAVNSLLENKIGILELGTGAGKSLIASEIIRRLDFQTLFVINRIELVEQTAEMFKEYLGVEIGTIFEGSMNIKNGVNVVSIQSINAILKRKDKTTNELIDYLKNVQLLIYDECHCVTDHGSYKNLAHKIINCHYIVGLTGTAFRNDEHTLRMKALVGDVIYKKTTKELVDEGYLTPTKCVFFENEIFSEDLEYDDGYADAYEKMIVYDNYRNNMIKELVLLNPNKKILILTKLIRHGKLLNELIDDSRLITSQTDKTDRKDDFKEFKNNEYNVLIGSMQIFSTGINLPDLDIIINASGNKTNIGTIQSIGRAMRKTKNKEFAYYYDFYDYGARYFQTAAEQRMKILQEFGHEIEVEKHIHL